MIGLLQTVINNSISPSETELNYEIHLGYGNLIHSYTSKLKPIDFCVRALYGLGYSSAHYIFINHGNNKPLEPIFANGYCGPQ